MLLWSLALFDTNILKCRHDNVEGEIISHNYDILKSYQLPYCYRVQLQAEKISNKRPYLTAALNPFLYLQVTVNVNCIALYPFIDKHINWGVIFQTRSELQRILGEEDCRKGMKTVLLDTWKQKLLKLLKQSSAKEVQNVLRIIDDNDSEDEKGNSRTGV